jgi:hypothetical protein
MVSWVTVERRLPLADRDDLSTEVMARDGTF